MSEAVSKLYAEGLLLSEEERASLAELLMDSIGSETYDDPMEDPEFRAELERRLESIDNGTAELIPIDEAFARMRTELAKRRAVRKSGESA